MADFVNRLVEIEPEETTVDVEVEGMDAEVAPTLSEAGLTEEQEKEIADRLLLEIEEANAGQAALAQKWLKWRRQLDMVPGDRPKNSPLINSSNICPPLTTIHVQTMAANLVNFFSQKPFFGISPLNKIDEAVAQSQFLTKYIGVLSDSPTDLNLKRKIRTIADELALHGRCVVKVPFTKEEMRFTDKQTGGQQIVVTHVGPEIVPIPQEDILYPKEFEDVTMMPWIAHCVHLPKHELDSRVAAGIYRNVEESENSERNSSTEAERQADRLSGVNGSERRGVYDVWEIYTYFDKDGDGFVEDYIFTIDAGSGKVLRVQPNFLGRRPFTLMFLLKKAHENTGRGIGQLCESLQDEVEGIHNVRNDNMKLANMRMLEMKKSIAKYNSEELYPGKILLSDTGNDIRPIQLSDVYPSSLQAEQQAFGLAAQVTGMSEVQRGFGDPTLRTRDTYRGQAMRMASSKGIAGAIFEGVLEGFNDVGMLLFYQLISHKDDVLFRERELSRLTQEEQAMLTECLNVNPTKLPGMFAFAVNTVDVNQTEGAKLETTMQMIGLYNQYNQSVMPLVQGLFGPSGGQLQQQAPAMWLHMMKSYVGGTKFMEKIMGLANVENIDDILPDTAKWEVFINMMEQQMARKMEAIGGTESAGTNAPGSGSAEQFAGTAGDGGYSGDAGMEMGSSMGSSANGGSPAGAEQQF